MHHAGKNGEHSCVPFNLSNTSCGFMLKEVDWGGKHPINSVVDWQRHETYPTGHNISEVDWGALHDSSTFLFLVNIDYDAKPKDFFTQELWVGLSERTSSTTLRSLNHVEGKLIHHLELQKDPRGEMKSSFSWTCSFKSPTSSTLCFDEPTLGKLNQETDSYMTKPMTKSGEHFYGENFIHDFPKSWKHIKEVDWGDQLKLN